MNRYKKKRISKMLILGLFVFPWFSPNLCIAEGDNANLFHIQMENTGSYFSYQFDFNESVEQRLGMAQFNVGNEALVSIECHLFNNSTNNITLEVEGDGWNNTMIPVTVGETINVTIANGFIGELKGDVGTYICEVYLSRYNQADIARGQLKVKVLENGWRAKSTPGFRFSIAFLFTLISVSFTKGRKKCNIRTKNGYR
jgi:hypothetical protein